MRAQKLFALELNFQAPLFRRSEMCYNVIDFHILGLN